MFALVWAAAPSTAVPPPDAPEEGAILAPAARLSSGGSASEYWDLTVQLDSSHRIVARFLIPNTGPGKHNAVAVGHVIRPDGSTKKFRNGRRKDRWTLSPDRSGPAPAELTPDDYSVDLLALAARAEGTIWLRAEMDEPLPVSGRAAMLHTWMNRSEGDLVHRRVDFFSLQEDKALLVTEFRTPEGTVAGG